MRQIGLLALLLGLLTSPFRAIATSTDTWNLDPDHTNVRFKVKHMMINWVNGEMGGIKGTLSMPGKEMGTWKLEATADAKTIDTRKTERDNHLRNADFLDVKKFPTIAFKSTKFEEKNGKMKMVGQLTLRGVTKEVAFDVDSLTEPVKDPWNNMRRGFSASTKIDRKEFGMKWNNVLDVGVAVGDEVFITVDTEFVAPSPAGNKKS